MFSELTVAKSHNGETPHCQAIRLVVVALLVPSETDPAEED